jgi:transcriptional regulator with XRE-family HTH domain
LQEDDLDAGKRQAAVTEAYGKPGIVRNDNQLSKASGISRSVLDGWWRGNQPTTTNMRRMAEALGVSPESLWLRWLGYEPPEPGLSRIAEEISDLREALLDRAPRRAGDVEQRDWRVGRDRGQEADDEPDDEPGTRPA